MNTRVTSSREMTEMTPQALINALISKGNEILSHARQAVIFRSAVAYVAQHIHAFVLALRPLASQQRTDTQLQGLRQLHELFVHFDSVLPHLSEDKWIQPALNWPANYIHKYIDGFRDNLCQISSTIGLVPGDIIKYDKKQDQVNKKADLNAMATSLQTLVSEISTTDAIGLQQQIEMKLAEIRKMIPDGQKRTGGERRPSCTGEPLVQMKKKVEGLLGQFKSINIEVEDLSLKGQIGAGGFGTVYKATRLSTSEIVAVKELRSDRMTMSSWLSLHAEVETMASVRHPFVLELVGAHIKEPFRIITRFCPGKSLFDRLHRRQGTALPQLTPTRLTRIAYQVAIGMAHLHSMNIVHRDLKTLNILLDDEEDGCVADFGLCGIMKDNQELCGGVGTPHYTAPEVLAHTRYGPKVDTFSYGVVLWEMLTRKVPYNDMSQMQIYEHVVTRSWRLPIPNEAPEGLKKLINRCWSKNPNDRPEFSEIVLQFERGEIAFPESEQLDFLAIKATRRCPPLDMEYALKTLNNPEDPHFSSIIYFICTNIDEKLRHKLRDEKVLEKIMSAKTCIDAVLLLAGVLLTEEEFSGFLDKGGLGMFEHCVTSDRAQFISAALRFGLKVPRAQLAKLKVFLPEIVAFLNRNSGSNSHTLQFLTRFTGEELSEFKESIANALICAAVKVDDQQTFDAIVALLPLCRESFQAEKMRVFYRLLGCDFVAPSAFVTTLIQANDTANHASLILSILKATAKSDITDVFLQFLQDCAQNEKEVFAQVYKMQEFFPTIQDLLESENVRAPLFLLFCVAPIKDAAMKLLDHPVLSSLIQMKGYQIQRLQIFTILCMVEEFCLDTAYIDGIIHLLVSSLSVKSTVASAVRLIGAFSMHSTGCQILSDNGVLELFTQLFLSSSSGDTAISHTILRNVAKNGKEIPQGSLIVSCLMQDMIYDTNRKCEILDTLIALVETMPGSVQEHDLQRIVMQQLSLETPLLVNLSLRLFSVCDPLLLRNIYPQLLTAIYSLLGNENMAYPEIIESCLLVVQKISEHFDIIEFVKKTELARYVDDVINLLPDDTTRAETFRSIVRDIGTPDSS